jgi:hypothetical protein
VAGAQLAQLRCQLPVDERTIGEDSEDESRLFGRQDLEEIDKVGANKRFPASDIYARAQGHP